MLLIGLAASTAYGHATADVLITSPVEGASVRADVDVVLEVPAESFEPALFFLELDGDSVELSGRVGANAAFTSLSLPSGERRVVPLRGLSPGAHQVTVRYPEDADNAKPDVVRNFIVNTGRGGSGRRTAIIVVVALVALIPLAVVVAIRRKRKPLQPQPQKSQLKASSAKAPPLKKSSSKAPPPKTPQRRKRSRQR